MDSKGTQRLTYGKYFFIKKCLAKGGIQVWRCSNFFNNCKARCKTLDGHFVEWNLINIHNHSPPEKYYRLHKL